MGLFNIGKKDEKPYRVIHYEGIDSAGINMPCIFFIKDNVLNISFNSEINVTLPMERIIKFEAVSQNDFMMKYKNTNSVGNKNNIPVSYLVITYTSKENEEKRIVLWAANHREKMYFIDLHYKYKQPTGNIEL